jgi:hypothetical protein
MNFVHYGGVCLKKSEPILRKIPTNETETMQTRQGKLFFWGFGFALPRLISRPQEGSGEECGRVSDWQVSEIQKFADTEKKTILCL